MKLLQVTVAAVVFLSLLNSASAQERMRIAWAGSTPSNTPIWIADQKGFFKRNGLNAEVIAISASTIVIQALLTGEVVYRPDPLEPPTPGDALICCSTPNSDLVLDL